jgi:ketosteroid isomerase-like protein
MAMNNAENEIVEIVERETRAWDAQDIDLLMTIWHPDMVWPWPGPDNSPDPATWNLTHGRFDHERWGSGWKELFETSELVHNRRSIAKIEMSPQGDGAFAIVDIDTLWRAREGNERHWKGRTCKIYTKLQSGEWKMLTQLGTYD